LHLRAPARRRVSAAAAALRGGPTPRRRPRLAAARRGRWAGRALAEELHAAAAGLRVAGPVAGPVAVPAGAAGAPLAAPGLPARRRGHHAGHMLRGPRQQRVQRLQLAPPPRARARNGARAVQERVPRRRRHKACARHAHGVTSRGAPAAGAPPGQRSAAAQAPERSSLGTGGAARGARAHLSGTRHRGCSEAPTPASARARDLQRPVMPCCVQRSLPRQRMRALAPRARAHAGAAARAAYTAGHAAATGPKRTHEGAALRRARAAGLG